MIPSSKHKSINTFIISQLTHHTPPASSSVSSSLFFLSVASHQHHQLSWLLLILQSFGFLFPPWLGLVCHLNSVQSGFPKSYNIGINCKAQCEHHIYVYDCINPVYGSGKLYHFHLGGIQAGIRTPSMKCMTLLITTGLLNIRKN